MVSALHTITSNDEELVIVAQLVHNHIGVGSDNLLLWCQLRALLELEITDGSGQGKVSVDASKVHEAASGGDSCLFPYISNVESVKVQPLTAGRCNIAYPRFEACDRMTEASHVP